VERKILIREFIEGLLARKGDTQPFSDEASLFVSGRLQSVDAIELAVLLEEAFAVDFASTGFDQEMIDTVDAISALVEGRTRRG
jgi:acyl carrier protein